MKIWHRGDKEKRYKILREWKRKNMDKVRLYTIKYHKKYPWMQSYIGAKQRCNNPKNRKYRWYGAKGIKVFLSKEECKSLWIRDNADKMLKPSIDRIDNEKDYTYDNCQFIELIENTKKDSKKRKVVRLSDYTEYESIEEAAKINNISPRNLW